MTQSDYNIMTHSDYRLTHKLKDCHWKNVDEEQITKIYSKSYKPVSPIRNPQWLSDSIKYRTELIMSVTKFLLIVRLMSRRHDPNNIKKERFCTILNLPVVLQKQLSLLNSASNHNWSHEYWPMTFKTIINSIKS